jgi:selenoprotein W-related protein
LAPLRGRGFSKCYILWVRSTYLRAAWMAQELLTTFESEIGGVVLVPGSGGIFDIRIDGTPIWSRATQGQFPDIKELKQLVRDRVAPGKALGHSDRDDT